MDSLSPELIREVFLYLGDKLDIGRLRLVHRTFSQLGKEVLFGRLYVQPSQHSLSRLLEVSRNASCAQLVREVALSVDAMRVMVWRPFTELGSKDIDKLDYRTLTIFRGLVDECQEFQKSSDYVAMLSASFSRLPRLSAVSLREVSPSASSHPGDVTLMGRYAHAIDPPHFHGSWGEKDHLRAFSALINAAYFSGATLASFTTTGLIDQALFDDQRLLRRAADVFKSCRELRLLFCGEGPSPAIYGYPTPPPRLFGNSLYNVISPAAGLEALKVEFSVCPPAGRGGVLFRSIFGNEHVWTRLREVVLGAIDLPYRELLAFLDRHKATLRTLNLCCCSLVCGSWCDLMRFLRGKLKLEKLELDDTLVDGPGKVYSFGEVKTMVDYVLRGGERLPGCFSIPEGRWHDLRQSETVSICTDFWG